MIENKPTIEITMQDAIAILMTIEKLDKLQIKDSSALIFQLGIPDAMWEHLCQFHDKYRPLVRTYIDETLPKE